MINEYPVILLLGGQAVSGAEKRIIETFSEISNKYEIKVDLVISRSMRNDISQSISARLERSLAAFNHVYIISDLVNSSPIPRFLYLNLFALRLLFKYRFSLKPYFCLLSPAYIPIFLLLKKSYFEVTSPDIVRMRSMRYVVNVYGRKLSLIAVSEGVREKIESLLKRTSLVAKGASILNRSLPYPPEVKSRSSFETRKQKVVIFAHRMIPRKNSLLATHAFINLAGRYPGWRFELYGDGPDSERVSVLCAQSSLNNLFFGGRTKNLNNILARSKIFVSLIEPDNYPSQSVLEAMAHGNALVLSNTGYSGQKFIDGNGILADLSENSVVSAIENLLLNEKSVDEMGIKSLVLLENKFSLDKYLEDTLRLIK